MSEPQSHIPTPGEVIAGKYRVEATIGEGGMAVVLAATHEILRQRVAVKVLQPKYAASRELRERFFREARALAALKSEHVARIFDVGTLETGAAYLVLEHLDGLDLHEVLQRDGAVHWRRAVRYILQACEGLKEAHSLGILHRDLKPSNMFLATEAKTDGRIKLLDFGLAKLKEEGVTGLTGAEAVMGSPSYMAPEQIKGLSNADERSDLWSMGVSLYELIADAYPFEADTAMKIAAAVIVKPPKKLEGRAQRLPPGLEDVVMACLVKEPENRIATAAELIRRLTPFATLDGYDSMPAIDLKSIKPFPARRDANPETWRERAAEPTYGGMMDIASSERGEDDGAATLVQFSEHGAKVVVSEEARAPASARAARGTPSDDEPSRDSEVDVSTLEKAPSAKEALAARAAEPTQISRVSREPGPVDDDSPMSLARASRRAVYYPKMPMREARARYFAVNRFGADGGYEDAWVDFKLGPIPFPFPNTSSRKRAVKVHDLHHILTGYDTDLVGEFEISAWEIGAGCRGFIAAWQLNLGGMAGGLVIAPRRTFRAFVRGRNSASLYGRDLDAMLEMTVADARSLMGVDRAEDAKAKPADVLLFVGAELLGFVLGTIMLALGIVLAPIGLLVAALRKRAAGDAA